VAFAGRSTSTCKASVRKLPLLTIVTVTTLALNTGDEAGGGGVKTAWIDVERKAGKVQVGFVLQYGRASLHSTNRDAGSAVNVGFSPCSNSALQVGLHSIDSPPRERLDETLPAPTGWTTTSSSAVCRGGMICGSASASLNFAPTTSSPDSSSVQLGDGPASWQAPLHVSNALSGLAVSVTSAKAANSPPQVPPDARQSIVPSRLVTDPSI